MNGPFYLIQHEREQLIIDGNAGTGGIDGGTGGTSGGTGGGTSGGGVPKPAGGAKKMTPDEYLKSIGH